MGDDREVIFCRICLRTDLTQKYILSDIVQRKFIETFFKENGYYKDLEERSYACFECRILLHRSYNFIQKALGGQKALYELQEKQEPLTNFLLQSLDREKYNINSNLSCSEPETYDFLRHKSVFKCEDDVITKTESNEPQEDKDYLQANSSVVSTVDQNRSNSYQLDINTESIRNHSSYCYNYNVKIEPEITIVEADDAYAEEYKYLDNFDPLQKHPTIDETKSDDEIKKVTKRKGNHKNKKDTKKGVQKRKVASNDKVKKKYKRVKWPEMPVFEERFRTRKNVSYRDLDNVHEKERKVKKESDDEDFVPAGEDSSDESADGSCNSYDDQGKVIKRKKDTREFPMECEEEFCKSIISSKREHQYHYLQMHRNVEYPYKSEQCLVLCPHCGETVEKRRLKEHEDKHAGIKIECDICHKKYSSKTVMVEHKKRVHQRGSRTLLVCDYCEMSFFMKAELLRHIRTHTGEKPFKCHLCDYRVAHKGNLHVHVRQFHQNMGTASKKTKTKDSKKKHTDKDQRILEEENLEENSSVKKDNRCKRKIKDGGEKKKKRRRKRKVVTDLETE